MRFAGAWAHCVLVWVWQVSAGSLVCFFLVSESFGRWSALNCFFLGMAGFASGGTDMVLTGSVAVDLGDPRNCISGVAGVINGFGVLGGVVQGGLVAFTYHWFGRSGITLLFGGLAVLPILVSGRAKKLDKKAKSVVSFMRTRKSGGRAARASTPAEALTRHAYSTPNKKKATRDTKSLSSPSPFKSQRYPLVAP
jgi:hypothetical protein